MKKQIRLTALLLTLALLFSLCLTACGKSEKKEAPAEETKKTENFEITAAMYNIYYYWCLSYYSEQFTTSYGFDASKSTKSQIYPYSGKTYYEEIDKVVRERMESQYLLYRAAKDAGLTLTEEESANIEKQVSYYDENGYESFFTANVTAEDVRLCCEISTLSQRYETEKYNKAIFEDDDVDQYYKDNHEDFDTFGCYCFTVEYVTDSQNNEDKLPLREDAEKAVKKLADCTSVADFKSRLADYMRILDPSITDENIQSQTEACYSQKNTYTDDEYGKWAFGDGRKEGDAFYQDDAENSRFNVLVMTELPRRSEDMSVNIRHILFGFSTTESATAEETAAAEAAAYAKAEQVLSEYQTDPTEAHFSELATTYTEDTASKENGGLYENIKNGDMVEDFNKWCMDASRQPGDVEIVKTDYGYHLMYFVGAGEPLWKIDVVTAMREAVVDDIRNQEKEKLTISFAKAIDSLDL